MRQHFLAFSAWLGTIIVSLLPWIEPGLRVLSLAAGLTYTLILIVKALKGKGKRGYVSRLREQMNEGHEEIG